MPQLRLDTLAQMDKGSADPIGTKAEVKALGLPLVKYATCSLPGKANRGCTHFDHAEMGPCPIRALLSQRGRPGPETVAVLTMKSPTIHKQDAMPCFTYMSYLYRMSEKQGLNHILGLGGDHTIRRRGSVALNPKDPRSGSKTTFKNEPVLKMLRPKESLVEVVESLKMAETIRTSRIDQVVRELDEGVDRQESDESGDELTEDDFVAKPGEPDSSEDSETTSPEHEELELDDLEDEPDGTEEGGIDT